MIALGSDRECCQWPGPCYAGCGGARLLLGLRCVDCRAFGVFPWEMRHERLCPHVARTTDQTCGWRWTLYLDAAGTEFECFGGSFMRCLS